MSDRGRIVDGDTIEFERLLPGSIEQVWAYLTEPSRMATWLAPGEIDLQPGGHLQLRFEVAEAPGQMRAGARIHGVVSQCEPPQTLSYSWVDVTQNPLLAGEASAAASHVNYVLREENGEVVLQLRHRGLTATQLPNFGAGWHAHLDDLRSQLNGEEPKPFLESYRRLLPWYVQLARLQPGAPAGRKGGVAPATRRMF